MIDTKAKFSSLIDTSGQNRVQEDHSNILDKTIENFEEDSEE